MSNADLMTSSCSSHTDAHGVFLTDYSWHLNAVSVLTGRSIVCGPDLFLYYHGIDTNERKADVKAMFESPADSQELFEKYSVKYVFIGSAERSNFNVDMAYFTTYGTEVYHQDGIRVFELNKLP